MLTRYEYALNSAGEIHGQMSSLFHGALMERIPGSYASFLHESRMHPYSQHLERKDGQWYWVINTLDKMSGEVIREALSAEEELPLQKRDMTVRLSLACEKNLSYRELKNIVQTGDAETFYRIRFITPTSFKRQGEYLLFPELFCIYQSLMNRFDSITGMELCNEDVLMELTNNSRIVQYQLKSTSFSLQGVRIPAFTGTILIKINGTVLMKRFANMLFHFGDYSGVGIKTSLGMGSIIHL